MLLATGAELERGKNDEARRGPHRRRVIVVEGRASDIANYRPTTFEVMETLWSEGNTSRTHRIDAALAIRRADATNAVGTIIPADDDLAGTGDAKTTILIDGKAPAYARAKVAVVVGTSRSSVAVRFLCVQREPTQGWFTNTTCISVCRTAARATYVETTFVLNSCGIATSVTRESC